MPSAVKARVLVLDANAPWVRSLFLAFGEDVQVHFLRVYHAAGVLRTAERPIRDVLLPRRLATNVWESFVPTLGWRRFPRTTARIIARRCRSLARRFGPADWIVYTLPHYAALLDDLEPARSVYYAHDPFQFYDWSSPRTAELEQRLLERCTLVAGVSRRIVDDFRPRARAPVFRSANAVADRFLDEVERAPPRPGELGDGKTVGCVGQINRTYDWELVRHLCERFRSATFVFVGPIIEPDPDERRRIERALGMPNVRWLGPREHSALPAYLAHFDVCLNPLAVSESANRRSPLRLYDYLATDRPILSTAIAEALEHAPHVHVARDVEEAASLLAAMLSGAITVDVPARRAYARRHTWSARAREFGSALGIGQDARAREHATRPETT